MTDETNREAAEASAWTGHKTTGVFVAVNELPLKWADKITGELKTGAKALVTLMVGKFPIEVEFFDREAVSRAIGAPRMGDAVTVEVYHRAYKDRIYYRGVSPKLAGA